MSLFLIFNFFFVRKPVNAGPGAMKLGGKSRDVDSFVDQLKEEGENVVSGPLAAPGTKLPPTTPQIMNTELYVISVIYYVKKKFKICIRTNKLFKSNIFLSKEFT